MIMGLLPFRADMLKKPRRLTDEDKLLRDNWQYVNPSGFLKWKNATWVLLFKVIDTKPRKLPRFDEIDGDNYQYLEFMAISQDDKRAELYAYGNFLKGEDRAYLIRGKQVIRVNP